MRVIVIRPRPGCDASLAAGRVLGLPIEGHPLSEIRPVEWQAPDPEQIDALLIGSANALRHGGPQLERFKDKPVHAVGQSTAALAREMGFALGHVGSGGLQQVLGALAPQAARLLRLTGSEHVPLEIPADLTVQTRIAYHSAFLPMTDALIASLADNPLVLLHSAASARYFAQQCESFGLDKGQIALAALGPRIAKAAGDGWAVCESAPQPNDSALLALALEMG